jgi:molybdenum cofactor biosynthesis enzyme
VLSADLIPLCRQPPGAGVEMEALTAVSVALLTVYAMVKALDRGMHIEGSASWRRRGAEAADDPPNEGGSRRAC